MVTVVITTCRREAKIVFRAIESVLRQTYKDWELIVVDDSPNSYSQRSVIRQKCAELSSDYSIICINNEKNSGACYSRNEGLYNAHGDYIAYLDDDDEWLPTKLEKQVQRLNDSSADVALVYCSLYKIDDETEEKYIEYLPAYSGFLFDQLMKAGNFVGGMSIPMMRTTYVKEVGGFDNLMQSAQDLDLWLRLALKYKFTYIEEPLSICHTHKGEQISKNYGKKIAGLERLNEKNSKYLITHKDVLWERTLAIIPYYVEANRKKEALQCWQRAVKACPYKIKNIKELIRIMLK